MLSFNNILLFSEDPKKLSEFYSKIFGKEPDWIEGGYFGYKLGGGYLTIGPHEKVHGKNQNPERMIINFETENFDKDFERIKSTGVQIVAMPYHPGEMEEMTVATLEDPDGNYFQLNTPVKM